MRNLFSTFLFVSIIFPTLLQAQVTDDARQRRRAFIEQIMRELIESQNDRGQQQNFAPDRRQPEANQNVSPEIKKARAIIKLMAADLDELTAAIQQRELEDPRLRPVLADLLKLQANLAILGRGASQTDDMRWVAENLKVIDRDWRMISYRLSQVRGFAKDNRHFIDHMNEHEQQLCELVGLTPQLNRGELNRLASSLNVNFQHLQQDIYYEMQNDPQQAVLLKNCQSLQAQIRQATALIDRGDYDSIVNAYKSAHTQWRKFALELRRTGGERVRKDVIQIEQIGRAIQEQLWLQSGFDREYLVLLASSNEAELDQILNRVSLAELLAAEGGAVQILAKVRDFKRKSNAFIKSLEKVENSNDVALEFQAYLLSFQEVHVQLGLLKNPAVDRSLAAMYDSTGILQETLGEGPNIGRRQIVEMAEQLDQLSLQLVSQIKSDIMPSNKYEAAFRKDFARQADELHHATHHLHETLLARGNEKEVREQLDESLRCWAACKPSILKTEGPHRRNLNGLRSEIEPLMFKLQIVLSD